MFYGILALLFFFLQYLDSVEKNSRPGSSSEDDYFYDNENYFFDAYSEEEDCYYGDYEF